MKPTADDTAAKLELIAMDPLPNKVESRKAVVDAVIKTANKHDGLVTMAWVRKPLKEAMPHIDPHQIGAQISGLVTRDILIPTGEYEPSDNTKAGNKNRPMNVYRLNRRNLAKLAD